MIRMTKLTYRIYKILLDLYNNGKKEMFLSDISNFVKLTNAQVKQFLDRLKAIGLIDFEEIRDKYYGYTYAIILKDIKNDVKKIKEDAKYVYIEV